MNAPVDQKTVGSGQLQREAQAWLRRLTSGKVTQHDAQAFRLWRTTSALHEEAFVEAQRGWNALGPAMRALADEDKALADKLRSPRRPALGRRAFVGGAVSVIAAAGVAVVYPPAGWLSTVTDWRADYRTDTGEQRRVALADRVSVDMNTLTRIARQDVNGQTVGIELISGEASVDLAARAREFSVISGAGRSVAQSGRFEVRHTDDTSCVTCVDGAVEVRHRLGTRRLTARQQVTYDRQSLGEVVVVDPVALTAWRDGILVFRQTPLDHVIEEINRYRPGHVLLLNRSVGNREVSGRFSIRALDTVLVQIQHTYALHAERLPAGLLLLS
ncbi:MAG TPA: FecR domain-containing protein [Paraburkholderia sp.]|jgi:transmembrane sensor